MKNCIRTKRGVTIVTMDEKTAKEFKKITQLKVIELRSRPKIYRAWLPKNYIGGF